MFQPLSAVLDIIFPPVCLSCRAHFDTHGEKESHICTRCQRQVMLHTNPFYITNPGFLLYACAPYSNLTVRKLIYTLKYQGIETAIDPIKKFIIEPYVRSIMSEGSISIGTESKNPTVIVPIPLHKKKLRKRGFNQAELIAHTLKTTLRKYMVIGLPYIEVINLLTRARNTESQTDQKSNKERAENAKGCFKLQTGELTSNISHHQILLVDDVSTSGATLTEAARTIQKAGYKNIAGFTLAKA
jgi:ComF family protein